MGISNDLRPGVLRIMDKRGGKVPDDELLRMLRDLGLNNDTSQEVLKLASTSEGIDKAIDSFREFGVDNEFIKYYSELIELLDMYGIRSYMDLDMGIVRGPRLLHGHSL
ncbi:hypothetical protein [Vulcanisaeta distributa]|uniref:hypothetical protein n=1 Tax=Vulcanisaeta distributa TaxID=164451 RepID=UPI000A5DF9F2|nr:hypothetical protein [Vulcanisaeta distributa]